MAKLNYRARDRYGRGVGQIGPTSKDMLEDLQRDMQNRATSIGDIINIASTIISGVNLAQTVKESGFKEALKEQFNPTIEFDGKTFELNPEDVYKEVDRKGIKSLLPDFRDFDERFKINEELLEELEKNPELFKKLSTKTQGLVSEASGILDNPITTKINPKSLTSAKDNIKNLFEDTARKTYGENKENILKSLIDVANKTLPKDIRLDKLEEGAYNTLPVNLFDGPDEGFFLDELIDSFEDLS